MAAPLLQAWKRGAGPGPSGKPPLWQPPRGHPRRTSFPITDTHRALGGCSPGQSSQALGTVAPVSVKTCEACGEKWPPKVLGMDPAAACPEGAWCFLAPGRARPPAPPPTPSMSRLTARAMGFVPEMGGAQPHRHPPSEDLTSDSGSLQFLRV